MAARQCFLVLLPARHEVAQKWPQGSQRPRFRQFVGHREAILTLLTDGNFGAMRPLRLNARATWCPAWESVILHCFVWP
jgi:hypothetical protein